MPRATGAGQGSTGTSVFCSVLVGAVAPAQVMVRALKVCAEMESVPVQSLLKMDFGPAMVAIFVWPGTGAAPAPRCVQGALMKPFAAIAVRAMMGRQGPGTACAATVRLGSGAASIAARARQGSTGLCVSRSARLIHPTISAKARP